MDSRCGMVEVLVTGQRLQNIFDYVENLPGFQFRVVPSSIWTPAEQRLAEHRFAEGRATDGQLPNNLCLYSRYNIAGLSEWIVSV